MAEVRKSLWHRSLLLRTLVYSMIASLLMAGLAAFGCWVYPQRMVRTTLEQDLKVIATVACIVFWLVFVFGGAQLWWYQRDQYRQD